VPERIAHYRIIRRIGEGGMGTVFAAHDDRLDRPVALKVIRGGSDTPVARLRFWHEARAAAKVSHPNICQLFEIGEQDETLFIVMELLEGESLADRLARGPLALSESVRIALDMLNALEALHASGIVHRDLKPSNVFLSTHAVKLLDFGLAKAIEVPASDASETATVLTEPGMVLGTPRYMSPEQARGLPVDLRSDIFAAGTVLFEMLAGQPAFDGATFVDVLHAVAFDDPVLDRALPAEVARVVRRALAKTPEARYRSASVMAQELRGVAEGSASVAPAPRKSWLIVLPFRVLRSDSEAEFLAFGLGDAITSSLSALQSLGVRSSAVASRFAGDAPDLARIAVEAQVDLVLTGTLLRAGQQIRANTQLAEAPAGTLVWSHTTQVTMHDVFQVQDDIVQRVVSALALPLTAREHRLLKHDVPANPTAYEFYLRGSQLIQQVGLESVEPMRIARDLFRRSVEEDPLYAPAWARLGRCYRVIGKGGEEVDENLARAEASLKRALELNPDLSVAHNLYAQLEADLGRSGDALMRLTALGATTGSDPQVFAGLVQACRYCGLFEASVAAHERARSLDPHIATSVRHTYWMLGDLARALQHGGRFYFESMVLASMGRQDEALTVLRECERVDRPQWMRTFLFSLRALLEGEREASLQATERCLAHFRDPELWFYMVRQLAYLGKSERAFTELERVIDHGYLCGSVLDRDPWLASLAGDPRFAELRQRAIELEREIASRFARAGGEQLVALSPGAPAP
jgi:serine/threonine protein kinase/tetratricopeptide (TPR) repeat protein